MSDWEDFAQATPWFPAATGSDQVGKQQSASKGLFRPSVEFAAAFPRLTELLSRARVTTATVGREPYYLYGWTLPQGASCGWLCPPPGYTGSFRISKDLHAHHRLLLSCFGGISERWHEPHTWLLNLNSALIEARSAIGFNGGEDYYLAMCEDAGLRPAVNPREYVSFAFEANGNCTMYHKRTSRVLMFAPDHAFDFVTPLDGCPDYTLYTIDGCPDFRSWVEAVAAQWLVSLVGAD
jgi:hypothetical protein